ncbi:hypothetical protein [Sporosarcina newyorkensis]|uniref:hypothetical protein n=1 Tax=Sporosarcina newyorkensis TaxID=759851 RepID=UPI003D0588E4
MVHEIEVIATKENNALIEASVFLRNFDDYGVRVWDRRFNQFELFKTENRIHYISFLNAEEVLKLSETMPAHYHNIIHQVQL